MPITNVDTFYVCRLECMRVKRDISFHVIQHLLIHTRRLLLHHTCMLFRCETWRGIKILDLLSIEMADGIWWPSPPEKKRT